MLGEFLTKFLLMARLIPYEKHIWHETLWRFLGWVWRLQGQLDLGSGWLILESQVEAKLNVSESCCFYMWGSMFYLLVIFMQPFASIRNVDILWIATERWISSTQLWAEKNFFWQSLFSFILFSYLPVYTKGNPFLFILLPYFKDPFHLLFTNLDSTGRWLFPPAFLGKLTHPEW